MNGCVGGGEAGTKGAGSLGSDEFVPAAQWDCWQVLSTEQNSCQQPYVMKLHPRHSWKQRGCVGGGGVAVHQPPRVGDDDSAANVGQRVKPT